MLATMYNNLRSLKRDADEGARLRFGQFSWVSPSCWQVGGPDETRLRRGRALLWIAEYERRGLGTATELLEQELGPNDVAGALRLVVEWADSYGQVYIVQDVGTRTR
ncbi:hypothetical protein GGR52DRAFT_542002 [Hypoxylon sp. FL1284]|nr:hypothetical protein GGR52DRAFT_542002 [Hypoxylon sp. FL1284]